MNTQEKEAIIKELKSYKLIHDIALWMDRLMLDPIVGWVLPGFGDVLTSTFTLPYLYLSIVQLKSIPLTLAIIYNSLLDILIGLIPVVGIVGDFFKRAFSKNAALIKGYVEGDQAVIREVDRKAVVMAIFIVLFCGLIYVMIHFAVKFVEWAFSLF